MRLAGFAVVLCFAIAGQASAQTCYESSILSPAPFMGNNGEIFKLADGTIWEVKFESSYLYAYYPAVVICPSRGTLLMDKKSLKVQLVSRDQKPQASGRQDSRTTASWTLFEETNLQRSISGTVQQGRVFKTVSGNIYEVVGLTLQLVLELQPDVTVLRNGDVYKLIVKGFDEPLLCRKLN